MIAFLKLWAVLAGTLIGSFIIGGLIVELCTRILSFFEGTPYANLALGFLVTMVTTFFAAAVLHFFILN
jgi:hypothetical protein